MVLRSTTETENPVPEATFSETPGAITRFEAGNWISRTAAIASIASTLITAIVSGASAWQSANNKDREVKLAEVSKQKELELSEATTRRSLASSEAEQQYKALDRALAVDATKEDRKLVLRFLSKVSKDVALQGWAAGELKDIQLELDAAYSRISALEVASADAQGKAISLKAQLAQARSFQQQLTASGAEQLEAEKARHQQEIKSLEAKIAAADQEKVEAANKLRAEAAAQERVQWDAARRKMLSLNPHARCEQGTVRGHVLRLDRERDEEQLPRLCRDLIADLESTTEHGNRLVWTSRTGDLELLCSCDTVAAK
jgi:hypothetical protein